MRARPDSLRWARCAALAAAYWLAAHLSFELAIVHPSASPVWPPSAMGLAALLLWGRGLWPGILAGAFAANLQLNLGRPVGPAAAAGAALVIAAGNSLEALAAAWLTERFAQGRRVLESSEGVFRMACLGAGAAPLVSATFGVAALETFGLSSGTPARLIWRDWWLGDAAGILIFGPFLIAWLGEPESRPRAGALEVAGLVCLIALTATSLASPGYPLAYVVLPLVLWSAFRVGRRASSSIVVALSGAAIYRVYTGQGPFATGSGHVFVQVFMGTVALSTHVLGGVLAERERVNDEILRSRDRLEEEVQRRTRELVQAQKMEAVGRLAGGVAHEFNNLLTGIMGLAGLVKQQLPPAHAAATDVDGVLAACRRGAGLVSRLLAFSRRSDSRREPVYLNEIIEASRRMLAMALGKGVEFDARPTLGLAAVAAAPGHVEQILLNLCLNSRDAMQGSGRIVVSTYARTAESGLMLSHGRLKPGDYCALSVADSGGGIPAELRGKIFEPFFTTKKAGSGLGLSIVYAIVTELGGAIDVRPSPTGVEFHLFFPALAPDAPSLSVPAAAEPARGGTEAVLVADDEEVVRESLARALRARGYEVLEASDGEQACVVFEAAAGRVHAVVLDVVMPKLSGGDAYERLRAKYPGLKVLFMSGHVTAEAEKLIREGRHPFVEKPFEAEELAARLRAVLDGARG